MKPRLTKVVALVLGFGIGFLTACENGDSPLKPDIESSGSLRPSGTTITVTNTLDGEPAPLGSLRWAIELANSTRDHDTIEFDIDSTDPANDCSNGVCTISAVNTFWASQPITINGPPQANVFDPPVIKLEVGALGMTMNGPFVVRWLAMNRPIIIFADASGFVIENNYIGIEPNGDVSSDPVGIAIFVGGGGGSVSIGGRIEGNVLVAEQTGIVFNSPSENIDVVNNRIGVDPTGQHFMETLPGDPRSGLSRGGVLVEAGGGHRIVDNVIASAGRGIVLKGRGGNVVQGNRIGTDLNATKTIPSSTDVTPGGIWVASDDNTIGLDPSGHGSPNIIGSRITGVFFCCGVPANDNYVLGNIFGQDEAGNPMADGPRVIAMGVNLGSNNVIGLPGLGNRVCCYTIGMTVGRSNSALRVMGNRFESISQSGFRVTGPVQIGGTEAGEGNTIVRNGWSGILVRGLAEGATLRGNTIYDNGMLGIDLNEDERSVFADGPTANDPLDADDGGNGLQNFPVITRATTGAGVSTIEGTFHSEPSKTYDLEFFSNSAIDPSGFGEGENPLGLVEVSTDASGDAVFLAIFEAPVPLGHFATATATDADGNTSEFSLAVEFASATPSETIETMVELLEDLREAGELRNGPANGMSALLNQAIDQLDRGNDNAAIRELEAFVRLVERSVAKGDLSAEDGELLTSLAEAAIQRIGG